MIRFCCAALTAIVIGHFLGVAAQGKGRAIDILAMCLSAVIGLVLGVVAARWRKGTKNVLPPLKIKPHLTGLSWPVTDLDLRERYFRSPEGTGKREGQREGGQE